MPVLVHEYTDASPMLAQTRPDMFEGTAKEFFLRAHDCTCSALLKLEILSQLVNESNAQLIMREFNAYIKEASRDTVREDAGASAAPLLFLPVDTSASASTFIHHHKCLHTYPYPYPYMPLHISIRTPTPTPTPTQSRTPTPTPTPMSLSIPKPLLIHTP